MSARRYRGVDLEYAQALNSAAERDPVLRAGLDAAGLDIGPNELVRLVLALSVYAAGLRNDLVRTITHAPLPIVLLPSEAENLPKVELTR